MARLRVPGRVSQADGVETDSSKSANSKKSEAIIVESKAKSATESNDSINGGYNLRRSGRMTKPRALSTSSTEGPTSSRAGTPLPPRQSNGRFAKSPASESKRARHSSTSNQQTAPASRATTPDDTSKPKYNAPEQELETMEHLVTYIKPFVDPETFATYSNIISTLNRRGPKSPQTRVQYRQELEVLLREDKDLLALHNEVARMQNKRNEGYHERFMLPVFKELNICGNGAKDLAGDKMIDEDDQFHSAVESMDGTPAPEEGGVNGDGDVEMRENRTALASRRLDEFESSHKAMQVDNRELSSSDNARHSPVGSFMLLTTRAVSEDLIINTTAITPSPAIASSHATRPQSPPPSHQPPRQPRIEVPTTAPSFSSFPSPKAPYYLAWLHQRQVRFPSASPVHAECVGIARRFGRPAHTVFDDIMYHWLLETDTRHGEWHKLNRQIVLGEDPVFDGDTRYWWEKEARELF